MRSSPFPSASANRVRHILDILVPRLFKAATAALVLSCAKVPLTATPLERGLPDVTLSPAAFADEGGGERAYSHFQLTNRSPDRLLLKWGGYGRIERRDGDGHWTAAPTAGCATDGYAASISPDAHPLDANATRTTSTSSPLGREPLPAGNYRFVVGFTVATHPDQPFLVEARFDIEGIDAEASEQFLTAFASTGTTRCLDAEEIGSFAERFSFVAHPRHVLGLARVPARSSDDSMALLWPLGRWPEGCRALAATARATQDAHSRAAGIVVMHRCRDEQSVTNVVGAWSSLAERGELPREVIDALARRPSSWSPTLRESLLRMLETTTNTDVLVAAAEAIAAGAAGAAGNGDDTDGTFGARAAKAIRRRSEGSVSPDVRKALLASADSLTPRRAPDTSDATEDSFGEGGIGLVARSERGGECTYDATGAPNGCCRVRLALDAMLKPKGPGGPLTVVQRGSSVSMAPNEPLQLIRTRRSP